MKANAESSGTAAGAEHNQCWQQQVRRKQEGCVSARCQCLSSGTRAVHTRAAHTCCGWPACLEAEDAWTGDRRNSRSGCRMHLLTHTPGRPGTATADSRISARGKNRRSQQGTGVHRLPSLCHGAHTPQPAAAAAQHTAFATQVCRVVWASPAHSATRARAHAQQPTACCFTVSRPYELHPYTAPHTKPCNMSHGKHRFPWLPLARREHVHSCQPLSTAHTRRNSTAATRKPVTSTQRLRPHRSAHMHNKHNRHTTAAHHSPYVGLSRPYTHACRLNCTQQARAHGMATSTSRKGCCSASHAPDFPSPHEKPNHETLALSKLQQRNTTDKANTLPNTRTASRWHLNSTSRQACKKNFCNGS